MMELALGLLVLAVLIGVLLALRRRPSRDDERPAGPYSESEVGTGNRADDENPRPR